MKSTTVHLGKGKAYIVKAKSKNKPINTGYCNAPTCLAVVQLDDKSRCLRCFNTVTNRQNHDSIRKWFDKFLEINEDQLRFTEFYNQETMTIPVPDHKRVYYVPLRYFVEYSNLMHTNEYIDDKKDTINHFFMHIKSVSLSTFAV